MIYNGLEKGMCGICPTGYRLEVTIDKDRTIGICLGSNLCVL